MYMYMSAKFEPSSSREMPWIGYNTCVHSRNYEVARRVAAKVSLGAFRENCAIGCLFILGLGLAYS